MKFNLCIFDFSLNVKFRKCKLNNYIFLYINISKEFKFTFIKEYFLMIRQPQCFPDYKENLVYLAVAEKQR